MRGIASLLATVVVLSSACTPERSDRAEPPQAPPDKQAIDEETATRIDIYAAVFRHLIRYRTLGERSLFQRVYVIDGLVRAAGNPRGNIFVPPARPFSSALVEGLRARLQDLPRLRFVGDADSGLRVGRRLGEVKGNGVIVALGAIERKSRRVLVPNTLWCGGKCSGWVTYVLREVEGRWKVTGNSGPVVQS